MIQHYIKHGSKVGLSTDRFNKWLKKPSLKTSPPRGNQSADWDYTSLVLVWVFILRAPGRSHHLTRWVHLKHKLGKREYKSYSARLTEELYYSCTCIKAKVGGVQLAEALTWLTWTTSTRLWGKKRTRFHYLPPIKYTAVVPLSTSPREGTP